MGVQRGSIISVCATAYELPTLGVDGSRSLKGYEVMAHPPTRNIQNVSVALYCAGGLPSGFLFQGAASGLPWVGETGKGLSCFSLRGPVHHGIVTMEDILEEIVGEISDEYDEDEQQFIRLADGSLIFEAKILLTDFFRVIDADPSDFGKLTEEVETLAGLLLEIKGDFPRRREIIDFKEYRFQVLEVDNRRILKVKFNRIPEGTGNDENGKDTK